MKCWRLFFKLVNTLIGYLKSSLVPILAEKTAVAKEGSWTGESGFSIKR
ncbi:hypothetical protein ACE1TI_00165 [Alteribacillus sp. JSM 102045]